MLVEILETLPTVLTATAATAAACVGVSTACLPILRKALLPPPKEAFLSDILPFSHLDTDGKTIICKDGTKVRVIALKGLDYGTKSRDDKISLMNSRHAWLDAMAKEGLELMVMTHRQRVSFQSASPRDEKENPNFFPGLEEINKLWSTNFENTFHNHHYVVLTKRPVRKRYFFGARDKAQNSNKHWQEQTEAVLDYLSAYGPELLTDSSGPDSSGPDSSGPDKFVTEESTTEGYATKGYTSVEKERRGALNILKNEGKRRIEPNGLLSFWSKMINGFDHPIQGVKDHLSERMTSSTVRFHSDTGTIETIDGSERLYSQVISIKQWNDAMRDDLYEELYTLPCELRLIHWVKGQDKATASGYLRYAQTQAKVLFFNYHVKEQYDQAIEWVDSNQSSLFDVQVSLIVTCETKETLLERVQEVRRIFRSQNLKPVIETHAAEWIWFSQFPSFTHRVRNNLLFSQNVATLLPFVKDQQGFINCDWGRGPLRLFKTSTGSTYAFQLHVSDRPEELAHSLVIAPSGSGKTTLFQHLIGGALRHQNLRAYIFDRLRGTKVFTESMGGQFIDLEGNIENGEENKKGRKKKNEEQNGRQGENHIGTQTNGLSLNPLQCDDNPTNRAFLNRFLLQLAGTEDDASIQAVNRAVDTIFELPLEARILSSIYDAAIDVGSPLKTHLRKWVGDTVQARWFNGKQDSLDITKNRLVSFEMAAVQQDNTAYAAMVTYVMHRIREQMQNKALPHLIFIDETAPMLENVLFRSYVKELFREHRKLRGSINVCFQDASAVISCGIKETILNQCQTVFLFPNPNADKSSYSELFNLTEDQWAFIKGAAKNMPRRSVLVKRMAPENNEAVILDIDLSCLGSHLKFYRSGSESIQLMQQLQHQYGLEGWRQPYLESSL